MGYCAQITSISIFSVRNQADEIIFHYVAYQTLKDAFKNFISKYLILISTYLRVRHEI
jgi:hypothetical protein